MKLLIKATELFSYNELLVNETIKNCYIKKQQTENVDWLTDDINGSLTIIYNQINYEQSVYINSWKDDVFKRYLQIKYQKYLKSVNNEVTISDCWCDEDFLNVIISWFDESTSKSTLYFNNLKNLLSIKVHELIQNEIDYQNLEESILEKTHEDSFFDVNGNIYDKKELIKKEHIALSNIYIFEDEKHIE